MTILDATKITACGLSALIRETSDTTLIVDCRGFTEFNESHIKRAINAFFSKLIRRRLFENKLDKNCLIHHLTTCTDPRIMNEKLDVVLYAEEDKPRTNKRRIASCNAPESSTKILRILRDRLEETDKFRSVMVLEGGYKQFATQYPQLCNSSDGMTRLPQSLSQPCLSNPSGDGITLITPGIYLGSQVDSLDDTVLKALEITAVINLSVNCPKSVCIRDEDNFMRIPVNDSYQEKLIPHFGEAFEFLERIRKSGQKCLIHCLAGISRSPTLCISYIMRHMKMGSDEAYRYVKERRPSISPNFNFMGQLLEYEHQLIRENVLKPAQLSRPYLIEQPGPSEKVGFTGDLSPPKVPKSASAHCVYAPTFPQIDSESEQSEHLNSNGKRGKPMDRPKALGFFGREISTTGNKEMPSPSTELSRLSFDQEAEESRKLVFSNPRFVAVNCAPNVGAPRNAANMEENPLFCGEPCSTPQTAPAVPSGLNMFMWRQKSSSRTSRPECLRSAGVLIPTIATNSTLATTTEETEAESPESGFVEEMRSEDDAVSIGSGSSLEISCP